MISFGTVAGGGKVSGIRRYVTPCPVAVDVNGVVPVDIFVGDGDGYIVRIFRVDLTVTDAEADTAGVSPGGEVR